MCIICKKQYNINSIILDCRCTSLTSIPDTFGNLTTLYCFDCANLVSIPHTLTFLYINHSEIQ